VIQARVETAHPPRARALTAAHPPQIRSHAQKYFLKVQKNGTGEHVPPPRPKRKSSLPYPQKAPDAATGARGGFVIGPTRAPRHFALAAAAIGPLVPYTACTASVFEFQTFHLVTGPSQGASGPRGRFDARPRPLAGKKQATGGSGPRGGQQRGQAAGGGLPAGRWPVSADGKALPAGAVSAGQRAAAQVRPGGSRNPQNGS
jgi:hypothetical protein